MGLNIGDLALTSYEINMWNRTPDRETEPPTNLPEFVVEKISGDSTVVILGFKDQYHARVISPRGNIGWIYWSDLRKV